MVEKRSLVQREGVYRWFSELNSAQRVEFLCGLLDLCVPIELRFLGSCLEDLARKDYHSLRDAEIKANNPADLAHLTNITDEVVRSKLLISLALLNSDNREAAGELFRTLTHIDSIINNYGLQLNDGQTGDQFLLLFTMASNHPAFSFHQKQVLRQELTQIQTIVNTTCNNASLTTANTVTTFTTTTTFSSCIMGCHCCHKILHRDESAMGEDSGSSLENALQTSAHSYEELSPKGPAGKHCKVHIERIELKGQAHKKSEKAAEYSFEVMWSDSTVSTVSKVPQELTDFFAKLLQLFPDEDIEKLIPQLTGLDSTLDPDPRCLTSLPSHILKHDQVKQFFSTLSVAQCAQTTNPSCTLQHTASSSAVRPICGVASIQPVCSTSSSCAHQLSPPSFVAPFLSPPSGPILTPSGTLAENLTPSPALPTASNPPLHSLQSQPSQEQNGILDWLRKLRLHKYYPVFKQLTMEKFLALTEEDLNKYDLTQGAKKKLKTQLELQNREKFEKKYVVSQFPVPTSGVARVTPTNHIHTSNAELRVEVEPSPHPFPRDSSSSSGYSSSPTSPMAASSRDEAFDSTEDTHRRTESLSECPGKEKPSVLMNHFMAAGAPRPTAQVLPVQNDGTASSPYHLPLPMPVLPVISSSVVPSRMLSSIRKPDRGSSRMPPPPILSPLCLEERMKALGPGSSIKIEKRFPSLSLEMSALQPSSMLLDSSSSPVTLTGFAVRTKTGQEGTMRSPPGLLIETSTAPTATSNTIHHISHTPLKLQVSPSLSADAGTLPIKSVPPAVVNPRAGPYSTNAKVAFSAVSGLPMAAVPGTYCSNTSAPPSTIQTNAITAHASPSASSSPALSAMAENSCYSTAAGSGHQVSQQQPQGQSGCVCSSCGCSGNCGSYSALPANYAGYFQHPFSGPSVFTLPFLHFSPLCNNGYIGPQQYTSSTGFSYPMVPPPLYNNSLTPESMLSSQSGFVMPPMQSFISGAAGVYQAQGMMGNSSGHKRAGNVSCYNCGISGHRAQDCKQPPMDSNQQGTFRLKYAPPSENHDSAD
ncbi:zinc finger CCHC domain-containing protein 14 [Amia ocellicauda]|uniref:zinc finger CCHC domain-containing protein 14 n=1 Tax=Amia ocellicauda TaxID=2972642 RepID=UPI003464E289|nr:ZCH14 protein [Amia calva]